MPRRLTHLAVRLLDEAARVALRPPTQAEHLRTGRSGEEAAYFYLRQLGYVIVARNWRSPHKSGEIDLIGWDGDTLCFIEVKSRTTRDVKPAEAAVDYDKREEIRLVARDYLRRMAEQPPIRFDVVSIYWDNKRTAPTLIKGAFS
jgi:putative endonuclease